MGDFCVNHHRRSWVLKLATKQNALVNVAQSRPLTQHAWDSRLSFRTARLYKQKDSNGQYKDRCLRHPHLHTENTLGGWTGQYQRRIQCFQCAKALRRTILLASFATRAWWADKLCLHVKAHCQSQKCIWSTVARWNCTAISATEK